MPTNDRLFASDAPLEDTAVDKLVGAEAIRRTIDLVLERGVGSLADIPDGPRKLRPDELAAFVDLMNDSRSRCSLLGHLAEQRALVENELRRRKNKPPLPQSVIDRLEFYLYDCAVP